MTTTPVKGDPMYFGTSEVGTNEIQAIYVLSPEGLYFFNRVDHTWEQNEDFLDDIKPGGDYVYRLTPEQSATLAEQFGGKPWTP